MGVKTIVIGTGQNLASGGSYGDVSPANPRPVPRSDPRPVPGPRVQTGNIVYKTDRVHRLHCIIHGKEVENHAMENSGRDGSED